MDESECIALILLHHPQFADAQVFEDMISSSPLNFWEGILINLGPD